MAETEELRRLREIAEAQDAWGKRNTAAAWRRYREARDREEPLRPLLRRGSAVPAVVTIHAAFLL